MATVLSLALVAGPTAPFDPAHPFRGAYAAQIREAARIPAEWRAYAACVAERESHGNPQALSPISSSAGKWQLLDNAWRVNGGIKWIVYRQLVEHGVPRHIAREVREWVQAHPINHWPEPYQDAVFVEVVTHGGAFHWHLPGSRCNSLVAS